MDPEPSQSDRIQSTPTLSRTVRKAVQPALPLPLDHEIWTRPLIVREFSIPPVSIPEHTIAAADPETVNDQSETPISHAEVEDALEDPAQTVVPVTTEPYIEKTAGSEVLSLEQQVSPDISQNVYATGHDDAQIDDLNSKEQTTPPELLTDREETSALANPALNVESSLPVEEAGDQPQLVNGHTTQDTISYASRNTTPVQNHIYNHDSSQGASHSIEGPRDNTDLQRDVDEVGSQVNVSKRQSAAAPELIVNGHKSTPSQASDITTQSHVSTFRPPPIPKLVDWFQYLSSSKHLADIVFQVNHADRKFTPSVHYAHSLVVFRSTRMASKVSESTMAGQPRLINLFPARNIVPHAFEAAIKYLYSDDVLTRSALLPPSALQEKRGKAEVLEYVMSYWISGIELGLDEIKLRSYEVLQDLISFDIADLIAKEIQQLRHNQKGISDASIKGEITDVTDTLSRMLSRVLAARIHDGSFQFVDHAKIDSITDRFARIQPHKRSGNPSISSLTFGSLPSEDDNMVISAIMLNMNFSDMQILVAELLARQDDNAESLIHQVIQARERLRLSVVQDPTISSKARIANTGLWDTASYKEHFDHTQVVRERVAILLPVE